MKNPLGVRCPKCLAHKHFPCRALSLYGRISHVRPPHKERLIAANKKRASGARGRVHDFNPRAPKQVMATWRRIKNPEKALQVLLENWSFISN